MPYRWLTYQWLFIIIVLTMAFSPAQAQENLLANPGFETEGNWTPVASAGGGVFSAPPSWGGWFDQSSPSVPNGYPHRRIFVADDASEEERGIANGANMFINSGNFSANFGRGGGAFTGAIYQQVNVPEGSTVVGSASVIMNLLGGANLQGRVGIDPNGGTTPLDSDIVWSDWAINQIGTYRQLSARTTATGGTVTLFLYFTSQTPVDPNGLYWDDASLVISAAAQQPANPTAATDGENPPPQDNAPVIQPTAPSRTVEVQPAQADGTIIHVVQPGNTLSAIALAYGLSPQEIIELNNIQNPSLLRVGEELIIQLPEGAARPTQQSAAQQNPPAQPTSRPANANTTQNNPTSTPNAPVVVADNALDPSNIEAAVCVTLYEDVNINRLKDEGEVSLAGGTIELLQEGSILAEHSTTNSPDPHCFAALAAGDYILTASVPDDYGLTTPDQRRLQLSAGTTLNILFGAAQGVEVISPPASEPNDLVEAVVEEPEAENRRQFIQYLGLVVFALAGITLIGGLGVAFALRNR